MHMQFHMYMHMHIHMRMPMHMHMRVNMHMRIAHIRDLAACEDTCILLLLL